MKPLPLPASNGNGEDNTKSYFVVFCDNLMVRNRNHFNKKSIQEEYYYKLLYIQKVNIPQIIELTVVGMLLYRILSMKLRINKYSVQYTTTNGLIA